MADKRKVDPQIFLTDPEFGNERDIFNAVIDARLKFHAEEALKRKEMEEEPNILDVLFGGARKK